MKPFLGPFLAFKSMRAQNKRVPSLINNLPHKDFDIQKKQRKSSFRFEEIPSAILIVSRIQPNAGSKVKSKIY
jgi:hypothetical protein